MDDRIEWNGCLDMHLEGHPFAAPSSGTLDITLALQTLPTPPSFTALVRRTYPPDMLGYAVCSAYDNRVDARIHARSAPYRQTQLRHA
jgi:hypothetical protein